MFKNIIVMKNFMFFSLFYFLFFCFFLFFFFFAFPNLFYQLLNLQYDNGNCFFSVNLVAIFVALIICITDAYL